MNIKYVIDTSAVLTWFFKDEANKKSEQLLIKFIQEGYYITAPTFINYEFSNVILLSYKNKRIDNETRISILKSFSSLSIILDHTSELLSLSFTQTLAKKHDLTIYDASYLESAIRLELPLGTLDKKLIKAAKSEKIRLIDFS